MSTQEKADFLYQQQVNDPRHTAPDSEEKIIRQAVLRLNSNILGVVIGIISALVVFAATNWLVIKGGEVVGPHLALLSQFYIGYSVTFAGSLIGALYGFVIGYLVGFLTGWIYNTVIYIKTPKTDRQ